jgi:hypothetical protein
MDTLLRRGLGLWCWLVLVPGAQAARPFMTDDARLTTEGSCQLESWARRYSDRQEMWALPACNPGGNLEITLGGGRFTSEGGAHSTDQVLQVKTLFRPLTTNDWGWGLSVGMVRHPSATPGPNNLGSHYLYVPLSASMLDDKMVWHLNLGWSRDKATRLQQTTWGVGVEYWTSERWMWIAETFGDDRQKPMVQTGLRWSLVPGVLQIDATVGDQPGQAGATRWRSLGLRYTPDKLF